jgi:hypothetical protein
MDEQTELASTPSAAQQGERPADPHATIDVERLAERVYQLFLAEARLAHARGERAGQRRKH